MDEPGQMLSAPESGVVHRSVASLPKVILFVLGVAIIAGAWLLLSQRGATEHAAMRTTPIKIGILQNVQHLDEVVTGFKAGMAALGYVEGKDVVYDYQNANGDLKVASTSARKFVDEGDDLILAITPPAIQTVWQVVNSSGKNIPVVFTNGNGLVESGFFPGYKSTGKNMTGVVPDDVAVTLKKLEFMKEIQPKASKVGVFYGTGPGTQPAAQAVTALEQRAPQLGLSIVEYKIPGLAESSPGLLQKMADAVKQGDIDAIVTVPDPVSNFGDNPKILIALSKRIKAPVYFLTLPRVYDGGLLAYSEDLPDSGKQVAAMADKILKGTSANDIPLETTTKNVLIINLETAKEMGLSVPQDLIYVADTIIPVATSTKSN